MNVLLTGGAGYIGSHVALKLIEEGHEVSIVDNLTTGSENLIPKQASFLKCNINNKEKISESSSAKNIENFLNSKKYSKN